MTNDLLLKVENHSKRFSHVLANDSISLDIYKGEIHCLLGENGAGKTTLAECLYGAYRPDGGKISFKGQDISLSSPRDAIKLGIGMVHQHFVLSPPMTAIENIIVGTEMPGIQLKIDQALKKVQSLCDNYDIELNLNTAVSQLSVGEQQWVEILKALYAGVELLILDEPTAVLTPQEIDKFFSILLKMKQDGLSIILITHKLKEVMQISDRVTVLRKGKKIATVITQDISKEELAKMMVGREVIFRVEKSSAQPGNIVLEMKDLCARNDKHQQALHEVCLNVRRNEIVGLAGVAGNGQKELFDVLVGVRPTTSGHISLDGQEITGCSPKKMIDNGISSIPPDRIKEGLLMDFSIEENMILGRQSDPAYRKGLFFNPIAIDQLSRQAIKDYDIMVSSSKQKTRQLSGGNLQKIILSRELSCNPKCVIASSPTRGLDVGATEYIHRRLLALRDSGVGILLISEDLDEIYNLSDTIAVIYRGKIMGIYPTEQLSVEQAGLLMAGIREDA